MQNSSYGSPTYFSYIFQKIHFVNSKTGDTVYLIVKLNHQLTHFTGAELYTSVQLEIF